MDDEVDVERMTEFLNEVKKENADDDFEYEHFISDQSDDGIYNDEEDSNTEDVYDVPEPVTLDFVDLCKQDPIAALQEHEKQVINNCMDTNLKQLLILNRKKNLHLISLHKKIKDLLFECRQNIENKTDLVRKVEISDKRTKAMQTGIWKVGSPYFKDKDLFKAPPNEDIIKKKNNGELLVYAFNPVPKWKPIECERLVKFVKFDFNLNKQKALVDKIQQILAGTESELAKQKQRRVLEKELAQLKNKEQTEFPPRYSDDYVNWKDVANMFVKDNHTDLECRSMWNMYLHPQINKGQWSPSENDKLLAIAKKFEYQNWDLIAERLGTKRSSLQLCSRFYRHLYCPNKKGEFSHEEDMKLLDLVAKFQVGDYIPWAKIGRMFDNTRNRAQLYHRYTYYLSQTKKKLGKFTLAEDAMLMICVDRFGRIFRKCQQYLPNRTIAQCKSRYTTHCFGDIKKGSFTLEEDEIILKHAQKYGIKCWSQLAKTLKRSAVQVRQRYNTIQNYFSLNPQATIYDMSRRRKQKFEQLDVCYHLARKVADHFKNQVEMPTLADIQRMLRENGNNILVPSSETESDGEDNHNVAQNEDEDVINVHNIDNLLVNFFNNSYKIKENSNISRMNMQKTLYDVEKCLEILQADLDIPENLKDNIHLDKLDEEILQHLADGNSGKHRQYISTVERSTNICESLPPNTYTALGMRSLLIKHLDFNKAKKFKVGQLLQKDMEGQENIKCKLSEHLSLLDPITKDLVESDRNLFFNRFQSLFKNAAILTLDSPSLELMSISNSLGREVARPEVKRTFSKVQNHNSQDNASNKRQKICNVTEVSDISSNLTLLPVKGKSVIEELMKNKDKKLYRMDKINKGGKTFTVIKEVKLVLDTLPTIPSTSTNPCGSSVNSLGEDYSANEDNSNHENSPDDAVDLLKLESFLKEENGDYTFDDTEDMQE